MKLTPYASDEKSFVLYIGHPRTIAVHFQIGELGLGILDFELFHHSEEGPESKFLLRLEGNPNEIRLLSEAICIALKQPRPHPSLADLCEAALIDRSKLPLPESFRSLYELSKTKASSEVELARARLSRSPTDQSG